MEASYWGLDGLLSPIPALLIVMEAVGTCWCLVRLFGAPPEPKQYKSLDGLRGYLALFVLLHHSSIWYFYVRTGSWSVPPSTLYTHFGESSVALFFMITAFLFYGKLMDARVRPISWMQLLFSRVFRIMPLYVVALLLILAVVAVLTSGTLQEPPISIVKEVLRWGIFRTPDINGYFGTSRIVAGVTWSLGYEALFYATLPLLAVVTGKLPPPFVLLIGVLGTAGAWVVVRPEYVRLWPFLGGIAAVYAIRWPLLRRSARTLGISTAVLMMLVGVSQFPTAYAALPLVLLAAAFALIVSGNSCFGLFNLAASRLMGEMAYSIYLLHGFFLFTVFQFILGPERARELTPVQHWLVIAGTAPIVMIVSYATYRWVERPGIDAGRRLSASVDKLTIPRHLAVPKSI